MLTLKFAEVDNMVTFLSKPTESEDINGEARLHTKGDGKKVVISEASIRRDLEFGDERGVDCLSNELSVPTESVVDEAVNEKMDDRLVRATTIDSSLEAEQDSSNIAKTQSKATPNESSSYGTDSEHGSCLEATKTTQEQKIDSLKRRVKNLEKKQRSRTHKLKRLYKVGLSARVESSDDEGLEMLDADMDLQGEEVVVEQKVVADKEPIVDAAQVSAAATTVIIDDITLAKALEALKTSDLKIRRIVIKDHEEPKRMQTQEQQELNEEEKAKLFMELLEKRRKFFAAKRTKEKRNRPPTKAQQRSLITELLEENSKKVKAEITQEESSKRERDELEQETAKKQKIIDEKETSNLKQLVKVIPKEDIAIDAIPLAVKTLIVD
nr:hypothetical protein [Tanacetum cinerariifolium]GEY32862.1 hypothetical protein [Tanacetum cinerariifolium]GEY32872.1 hypothetical protein [Tanacetum cinerariifolium]